MITQVIKVNAANQSAALAQATAVLRGGGVLAFPTETVYGLGANALDPRAVAKIFAAKGRPADNPLIVHFTDLKSAEQLGVFNDTAHRLAERFWPGPLTLVLPKKPCVPDIVTAGLNTVALRLPSHPLARAVLQDCGLPVAAPSANSSGKPSPTTAAHVAADLDGKISLILDGGAVDIGLESTVLSLAGEVPAILRPGKISYDDLLPYLPDLRVATGLKKDEPPAAPGIKYRHYAPDAPVLLVKDKADVLAALAAQPADSKTCLLLSEPLAAQLSGELTGSLHVLCQDGDFAAFGKNLFAALRLADEEKAQLILVEDVPDIGGITPAIINRLHKAAGLKN